MTVAQENYWENENYAMSLTVVQRDNFINTVLDKMHQFGMVKLFMMSKAK